MADLTDFVQSPEVYECFNDNHIEVDIMLDYLAVRRIMPKNIYRDVCGLVFVAILNLISYV